MHLLFCENYQLVTEQWYRPGIFSPQNLKINLFSTIKPYNMQEVAKKGEISGFLGPFMLAMTHNFERIRVLHDELEVKVV